MAQSGYTPILIYASGTATNVPLAANLTSSASGAELALNYADGKLFYKDSAGVVQVLASKAGNVNVASFQTSLGGLTPSTATTGIVTLAGTLNTSSGGTGLSSYTAGDLSYYASGTVLSKLAIGTSGQILTSSGTAPQWSTLSGVAVTTFSAGTTGFTPSSATSGAITLAGTLATTNGGTGLTSFTANGVVYASSTSALATGSALTFDGTNLVVGGTSSPNYKLASYVASGNNGITIGNGSNTGADYAGLDFYMASSQKAVIYTNSNNLTINASAGAAIFQTGSSEQMRLTSTGLGIGTSSPASKLNVTNTSNAAITYPGYFDNSGAGTGTGTRIGFRNGSGVYGAIGYLYGASGFQMDIDTVSSGFMSFKNAGSEQMRLDAAGNLGLGVTPSAWGSGLKFIQIGNGAGANGSFGVQGNNLTQIFTNVYYDGTNYKYLASSIAATAYNQTSGQHVWYNAPSSTAGANATFTQAMTLDASGTLGVGTTSPVSKLQLTGASQAATTLTMLYSAIQAGSIGINSSGSMVFGLDGSIGTTTRLNIDTSGNLGLGVTPSAWATVTPAIELKNGVHFATLNTSTPIAYLGANSFYNGSNWIYKTSSQTAARYEINAGGNGSHAWFQAASGTAGNAITFTQAMTLDASGNLGVGTSSPDARLDVRSANKIVDGIGNVFFATTDSVAADKGATLSLGGVYSGVSAYAFGAISAKKTNATSGDASGYLAFYTTNPSNTIVERARIDSSGNLLVGQTSDTATSLSGIGVTGGNRTITAYTSAGANAGTILHARRDTDGSAVQFVYNSWSSYVGSISVTSTLTSYNVTSDYRLKTVVGAVTGHGARIDALEPIEYTWNLNGKRTRGFLAHKFQEVYADSVTGTKDAVDADGNPVYQQMQASTSEVIADLVSEIQSLRKRLAALEAK